MDVKTKQLFCSCDRYGVKPFYYYWDGDRFLLGSEIKEILAVCPGGAKADMVHLSTYLANGSLDYDSKSLFAGIHQLVGGYNRLLDYREMKIDIKRCYDFRKIPVNTKGKRENYREFQDKFMKSVRPRMRSDVKVGSCLLRGLDSSSIVRAVHKRLEEEQKGNRQYVVSSCFEDKRYDEQEYIDEVVKETGVTSYKVFPDMCRFLIS